MKPVQGRTVELHHPLKQGLESYFCAHLLTARRRKKEAAASPVLALWADADGPGAGGCSGTHGRRRVLPRPRASLLAAEAAPLPHRSRGFEPATGALLGTPTLLGWDLSQLLRPPGTRNLKYEAIRRPWKLVALDEGAVYHRA